MAFSNSLGVSFTSFKAGSAIGRDRTVKLDTVAGQVVPTAAITDLCIGVATGPAATGEAVTIQVFGRAKLIASAAIAYGAQLMPTAGGAGKVSTAAGPTAKSCALALEAASADGDTLEALIIGPTLNGVANT